MGEGRPARGARTGKARVRAFARAWAAGGSGAGEKRIAHIADAITGGAGAAHAPGEAWEVARAGLSLSTIELVRYIHYLVRYIHRSKAYIHSPSLTWA